MKQKQLVTSQFYYEFLHCWCEFYDSFDSEKEWSDLLWNNKEKHVNRKPVFYKNIFEKHINRINDHLFYMDITSAFVILSKTISKINYLTWTYVSQFHDS